jgi:predicted RNase H-like HicB family nuclease
MFGLKGNPEDVAVEIPVLCKFWQEDGVWNVSAEHIPVAAFGDTFEEARRHMADAICSHMQALIEAKQIDETVTLLKRRAQDHMNVNEIRPDSLIGKILVPFGQNQELAAHCV